MTERTDVFSLREMLESLTDEQLQSLREGIWRIQFPQNITHAESSAGKLNIVSAAEIEQEKRQKARQKRLVVLAVDGFDDHPELLRVIEMAHIDWPEQEYL